MTPSLMPLEVACPNCNGSFSLLQQGWQAQRKNTDKYCPLCRGNVEIVVSGLRLLIAIALGTLFAVLAVRTQFEPLKWLGYLSGTWLMSTLMYLRSPKPTD